MNNESLGFMDIVKNIIVGAGLLILIFITTFASVAALLLIPFVIIALYGMIVIRPTLIYPRDLATCWKSVLRFFLMTTLRLALTFMIFPFLALLAYFGFGLMREGDILYVLGFLCIFAAVWMAKGYWNFLYKDKNDSTGKFTFKKDFYKALRGRY